MTVRQFRYDPSQPRADDGKWTDGPGGASSGSDVVFDEGGSGTVDDPVRTDEVEVAAVALSEGKHVVLDSKRRASTLLDDLAAQVNAAREAGTDPPDINLCNVSVPGTNLFCVSNKGIPRVQMPQLGGIPIPGSPADSFPRNEWGGVDIGPAFTDHLAEMGIGVDSTTVDAEVLKATQNELVGAKVVGIAAAMESGEMTPGGPIYVTKDDYVVDGHHRWAATVAVGLGGGNDNIDVNVIDSDIITILAEANKFAIDMGIPPQDTDPTQLGLRRFRFIP